MSKLLNRAREDAVERNREKRAKVREARKERADKLAQLAERGVDFVVRKLELDIAPELRHQEGDVVSNEIVWATTIEDLEFEVVRRYHSGESWSLYLLFDDEEAGPDRRIIRRLADLVEATDG